MIPESVLQQQSCASGTDDWKLALAQSFRQRSELLAFCELQNELPAFSEDNAFPTRVTRHYASLIEKGNAQDPLLLQVLNDLREHEQLPGYSRDAVGDMEAMVIPGLLHKYASRVLLTLTAACPIHCRYCFRRHFPYSDANVDVSPNGAIMQYLKRNPQINEVILSGGDPLMWSDQKLGALIQSLNPVTHIKTLRIHSRLLSVLPERINDRFINLWHAFRGQVVFITHINHPNEISPQNRAAFSSLARHGFRLFNQSVLLRGVNNSPDVLSELSYRLFDSSITPYYLHALDKVQGTAHFDIDVQQQCQIYQALRSRLPGYLLPQLVNEFAGRTSKTPVQCC